MTCYVSDPDHFKNTFDFVRAQNINSRASFHWCIRNLNQLKRAHDYELKLYPDFSPNSFYFELWDNEVELAGTLDFHDTYFQPYWTLSI